jgi:hypothetical protein
MTKLTALLLTLTTFAATGCYAHAGYYAEPVYVAPAPINVVPTVGYVQPYGYGYERAHVYVAPRPAYRAPMLAARVSARPGPHRVAPAARGYRR